MYNLVYDEERGSATVCATPHGRQGQARLEWRLELAREDGWKVWLAEESPVGEGEYVPEPLLGGSGRLGDFEIEVTAYNEGYFQELGAASQGLFLSQDNKAAAESYPQYFSTEYRWRQVQVSYLGEESLEGRRVKVLVDDLGDEDGSEKRTEAAESYSQYDSDGNGSAVFDGGELAGGAPRLVCGGGNGYSQPGYCWKKGDRIGVFVRIYMDGKLAQEGEVWSGSL